LDGLVGEEGGAALEFGLDGGAALDGGTAAGGAALAGGACCPITLDAVTKTTELKIAILLFISLLQLNLAGQFPPAQSPDATSLMAEKFTIGCIA
jgi:hypothetical protein